MLRSVESVYLPCGHKAMRMRRFIRNTVGTSSSGIMMSTFSAGPQRGSITEKEARMSSKESVHSTRWFSLTERAQSSGQFRSLF